MSTHGYSFMKQIDFCSGQTVTVTERHSQWVKNISDRAFLFFYLYFHKEVFVYWNIHKQKHFISQVSHTASYLWVKIDLLCLIPNQSESRVSNLDWFFCTCRMSESTFKDIDFLVGKAIRSIYSWFLKNQVGKKNFHELDF